MIQSIMEKLKNCSCKKEHSCGLKSLLMGRGVLERLPDEMAQLGAKKVFLLADQNTYPLAGEKVKKLLSEKGIESVEYVFPEDRVEPDERAVGAAIMHFDASCDAVLTIGSGVLNDIGKIVANVGKIPCAIVATAPSMDGYASATSSMARDGLKISLPSKCPDVIVGDVELLKTAPDRMLLAGLGDMLAKYISICEWRIAREITGEYYCDTIAGLVTDALDVCVKNADGLLKREDEAVLGVFSGLVLTGVSMSFAGCSRPASGGEHYLSHMWDMRSLEFGTANDLHGIQCAQGTLICLKLYEEVLKIVPDREKALASAKEFDLDAWNKTLRDYLGAGAEPMIELEKKEGKYDPEKHKERFEIILEKWEKVRSIIEELPSYEEIKGLCEKLGLPDLGEEEKALLPTTFRASGDIRDKYVLPRLLWDLGLREEFAEKL